MTVVPPDLRCPRCGHAAGIGDVRCRKCSLVLICDTCHQRLGDPEHQRFCPVCGTPLPRQDDRVSAAEVAAEQMRDAEVGSRSAGRLFSKVEQPVALSTLLERSRRGGERVLLRTIRRRVLSLSVLYEQLGEELIERERFDEGIDAYQRALEEETDPVRRRQIYASLAESTALAAEQVTSMRPRAVRLALEAAARAPDVLLRSVERLAPILDADVLGQIGPWIAREWWPEYERGFSGLARVDCAIVAGRAALFSGDQATALRLLGEAHKLNSERAAQVSRATLMGPLVPPALLEVAPSEIRLVLARARAAVGDDERALDELQEAITIGFGADASTELDAHELRVALCDRLGRAAEHARAVARLGAVLADRERYEEALAALRRATELAPDEAEPWILFGEVLRLAAHHNEPPLVDEQRTLEGRTAVLEGLARAGESPGSWPYCILVLIDDQLAQLVDDPERWLLDALLAAEQALAADCGSADAWALSSRVCRLLGLLQNARLSADRAVRHDSESVLAAHQDVMLAIDLGDANAAKRLARHRATLARFDSTRSALAGYHALLEDRAADAGREFDRALRRDPSNPTMRLARALAAQLQGDAERAALEYARIADALPDAGHPYRRELAWARALAGGQADAAALFVRLPKVIPPTSTERAIGLAACAVANRDVEGMNAHICEAIGAVNHRGDAAVLSLFLRVLACQAGSSELRAALHQALEQAEGALRGTPVVEGDRGAAMAEAMASALADRPAMRVLRARLAAGEGEWSSTADLLTNIGDVGRPFPELIGLTAEALRQCSTVAEARGDVEATASAYDRLEVVGAATSWERDIGLARAQVVAGHRDAAVSLLVAAIETGRVGVEDREGTLQVGDLLGSCGETEQAQQIFERALMVVADPLKAELQLRLGLLAAIRQDVDQAHRWVLAAIDGVARAHGERGLEDLVTELYRLAPEGTGQAVGAVLRALDRDPMLTASRRRKLTSARLRVVERRGPRLGPISPIVLSLDQRHYGDGPHSPLVVRLVKEELPALRERLSYRTGVTIPGIAVAPHPEPLPIEQDYAMFVRQVWVASGGLRERHELCRDAETCHALGLSGPRWTLDDGTVGGVWLDAASAKRAHEANLQLLDHAAAISLDLELTIRPYLGKLIGWPRSSLMCDVGRCKLAAKRPSSSSEPSADVRHGSASPR
jgi:tetratricopeptide (TPR) repeat protein